MLLICQKGIIVSHNLIVVTQIFSDEVYLEISQIVDMFNCHFAENQNGFCWWVVGEGIF